MNPTKINIENVSNSWELSINGGFVARGFNTSTETKDDCLKRVAEANSSIIAMRAILTLLTSDWRQAWDHNVKDEKCHAEAVEGFMDGLTNATHRHDCYAPGVPDAPGRPGKGSKPYRMGYDLGELLLKCLGYADTGEADIGILSGFHVPAISIPMIENRKAKKR